MNVVPNAMVLIQITYAMLVVARLPNCGTLRAILLQRVEKPPLTICIARLMVCSSSRTAKDGCDLA